MLLFDAVEVLRLLNDCGKYLFSAFFGAVSFFSNLSFRQCVHYDFDLTKCSFASGKLIFWHSETFPKKSKNVFKNGFFVVPGFPLSHETVFFSQAVRHPFPIFSVRKTCYSSLIILQFSVSFILVKTFQRKFHKLVFYDIFIQRFFNKEMFPSKMVSSFYNCF